MTDKAPPGLPLPMRVRTASLIAVLRSVAVVWPFGSGRAAAWLGGCDGLEDQAGCDIGVCHERDVGAVDRLGDRAGALRHESLTVRRDRVVVLGDQVPARQGLPARRSGVFRQGGSAERALADGHRTGD